MKDFQVHCLMAGVGSVARWIGGQAVKSAKLQPPKSSAEVEVHRTVLAVSNVLAAQLLHLNVDRFIMLVRRFISVFQSFDDDNGKQEL
jgi:hypothetical protein